MLVGNIIWDEKCHKLGVYKPYMLLLGMERMGRNAVMGN
jgi:hypothetical protein